MTRTTLAVAADYADAMLVARRWKNAMVFLLLVFLLIQIGVFAFIRFAGSSDAAAAAQLSTTRPAVISATTLGLAWLINVIDFLAVVCVVVLAVVLLLIVGIMLVGRLIGVSRLTSAFVWCVLLGVLLFPWQSLWDYPVAGIDPSLASPPAENLQVGPRFGLPGVLYTWPELRHRAHFPNDPLSAAILGWARFVGWPVFALILLFSVQVKSSRGLRFALGEADVQVADPAAVSPPPNASI